MTKREEVEFQALVLSALWGIWDKDYEGMRNWWRALAIAHLDEIGQDTDEANQYRREVMFPERRS